MKESASITGKSGERLTGKGRTKTIKGRKIGTAILQEKVRGGGKSDQANSYSTKAKKLGRLNGGGGDRMGNIMQTKCTNQKSNQGKKEGSLGYPGKERLKKRGPKLTDVNGLNVGENGTEPAGGPENVEENVTSKRKRLKRK